MSKGFRYYLTYIIIIGLVHGRCTYNGVRSSFVRYGRLLRIDWFYSSIDHSRDQSSRCIIFFLYWRIGVVFILFICLFVFQNLATKTNLDNAAKTTPSTTQPPILPHQTIAQKNSCTKMRQPAINRQRLLAILSTSPSLKIACKITPIPTL